MRATKNWAAAAIIVAVSGTAQAELFDRGGGMVYDTTRNITWLADMNYAFTSGYAASGVAPGTVTDSDTILTDGRMGWLAATTWADMLAFGGYDDWRLPTLNPADASCTADGFGHNCIGGELSGLFVTDLGNKAYESVLNPTGDTEVQKANLALFSNMQSNFYWSSTEYARPPDLAWSFHSNGGSQTRVYKGSALYAVAVRPGDVAPIPEPESVAMLLAGLGVLGVALRRGTR